MADSEELEHIKMLNKFWNNHSCEEYAAIGDCMHKHPKEARDYEWMLSAENTIVVTPGERFKIPGWDGPYRLEEHE